jgi:hypothetical protein
MTWDPIDVAAEQPYPVLIGSGVSTLLPQFLDGVERVAIIHPPGLASALPAITSGLDQQVTAIRVPEAEAGKTAVLVASLTSALVASVLLRRRNAKYKRLRRKHAGTIPDEVLDDPHVP